MLPEESRGPKRCTCLKTLFANLAVCGISLLVYLTVMHLFLQFDLTSFLQFFLHMMSPLIYIIFYLFN